MQREGFVPLERIFPRLNPRMPTQMDLESITEDRV